MSQIKKKISHPFNAFRPRRPKSNWLLVALIILTNFHKISQQFASCLLSENPAHLTATHMRHINLFSKFELRMFENSRQQDIICAHAFSWYLTGIQWFFAPNQKVQKIKYVFIGPINTTALVQSPNFEIGTLSPPSTYGHLCSQLVQTKGVGERFTGRVNNKRDVGVSHRKPEFKLHFFEIIIISGKPLAVGRADGGSPAFLFLRDGQFQTLRGAQFQGSSTTHSCAPWENMTRVAKKHWRW